MPVTRTRNHVCVKGVFLSCRSRIKKGTVAINSEKECVIDM